jgi:vacuolar protein sorting-associated protein 35
MAEGSDQTALLEAATKKVKEQAFYMKRSMDQSDLKQALHFAKEMLKELRTQDLTPRNYYELYMKVLEELRYLEEFFLGLTRSGTLCSELYEQVQSCGMVLPRLYLLVTVGGVYIKSKQAPAKDILKDLVEMTKGVQHPMRGLFLRNYLSHAARELLPDVGSEYSENGGGTVHDSLEFVITNFSETNRLWVRMQSQGANKDKKKREKERQDLRILVGTNLVRLSQLEGVDVDIYKESVLPRVLEQVANCKDAIAQAYLMDCITHVFPDDFHLATLELFLQTCTQLKEKVNVRSILENMMDRLSGFGDDKPSIIPPEVDAFKLFNDCIKQLLEERKSLNMAEMLKLHKALLNFALKCYPGNLDYVNHCLGQAVAVLNAKKEEGPLPDEAAQEVESLLSIPLSSLALQVLALSEYCDILAFLPWDSRKLVGLELVRSIIQNSSTLSDLGDVEKMFELIVPLLKDDPDAVSQDEENESTQATLEYEQLLVSRMVHLMKHENTDETFAIYLLARKQFGQGGVKRIKYTLVPLVFAALKLVQKVRKLEVSEEPPTLKYSSRKVFQFVHEIVGAMASSGYPEVSLQLFLQCAMAADKCDFKAIAYEFISQASILYEDELTDSKAQVRALSTMVGTLLACRNFSQEDYDTLITKTTQYGAKLLKKPDQCRMVTLCSHLFWVGKQTDEQHYHDPRRVLECLQRSLKIADVCMSSSMHVELFVEILNQYLYYFEKENEVITEKYISGLIALINEHIENMDTQSDARSQVEAHYKNTLIHIKGMQNNDKTKEKFEGIVIFQNKGNGTSAAAASEN